jgi:antitoxin CcdA
MRMRMWNIVRVMKTSAAGAVRRRSAATKRATNVSVRSDLLAAARAAGVNLSAALERALAEELAAGKRAAWRAENREAIAAYNEHVASHGTFADDLRGF